MIIFNKEFKIETSKSEEQVLNRLKEEVIEGTVNIMVKEHEVLSKRKKEYFIGKIGTGSFILTRMHNTGRSVWSPIIIGTIKKGEKTTISIVFKAQLVLNLFLSILFAISLYYFVKAIILKSEDIHQILLCVIGFVVILYVPSLLNFINQVNKIKMFLVGIFGD